ncbi:amidohydrolase [Jannaschia sp. 2305UL9-9]|uniref:amidohydrolase family protein n=1 Tax=Jannaschia sp. 2305UL9-9 TaxID=3121638 RepID=UPI003529C3FF
MIVDAHQHFWQIARGDYGWLGPDLKPLYRDFMPDDLAPHLATCGIDATILVQAAPTVAETDFVLKIADATPFVRGVVGWVDFTSADVMDDIERLSQHPKLVGLRPMIQDIADDDWMLQPDLTAVFEAMIDADLTFDALVLPRHLGRLHDLLGRHPNLRTVVDHAAKPDIAHAAFDGWARDIARIAQDTDAYCKLSGLLTEAGDSCAAGDLAPYVTHLTRNFGARRLIWGSDWPVLTLAADYETWSDMARAFFPDAGERDAVFGGNAQTFYRFA